MLIQDECSCNTEGKRASKQWKTWRGISSRMLLPTLFFKFRAPASARRDNNKQQGWGRVRQTSCNVHCCARPGVTHTHTHNYVIHRKLRKTKSEILQLQRYVQCVPIRDRNVCYQSSKRTSKNVWWTVEIFPWEVIQWQAFSLNASERRLSGIYILEARFRHKENWTMTR